MSKSRPTSFQRSNACRVLPPEHMMTSAHSTTILFISSMVGTVSSSDTSRRFISHPISLNASVCRKNLSVRSKDAVPMYRTLGRSVPASSTTLSTIGCNRMPRSLPDATILICGTANEVSSPSLLFWSLLLTGSEIAWAMSSATTKSVSTCSSRASKCEAVAGTGKSSTSSTGTGCSHVVGRGADIISPVSWLGTTTWHVALPSPLTAKASLPTITNAASFSTPIASVDVSFFNISSACSERFIPFVPVASKWGTHIASTNPKADILV